MAHECNIKLYINSYDCDEVLPRIYPQKTIRELIFS